MQWLGPPVAEGARFSNAATDLLLSLVHGAFLLRAVAKVARTGKARELRGLVIGYLVLISSWQALGAYCHLWLPAPTTLSLCWFVYLSSGALCPVYFGILLSRDLLQRSTARWSITGLLSVWVLYSAAVVLQLDFAETFPLLPRELRIVLPPFLAALLGSLDWMPSALRATGQRVAGEAPLPLLFDGRGYASFSFDRAFDAEMATRFDLTAPFPCWRAHSLPCLFLLFAFGIHAVLMVATFAFQYSIGVSQRGKRAADGGALTRRCQRAVRYLQGGLCLLAAVPTIPITMALWGVGGGIDFMHLCSLPGMIIHCLTLESAIADADGAHEKGTKTEKAA